MCGWVEADGGLRDHTGTVALVGAPAGVPAGAPAGSAVAVTGTVAAGADGGHPRLVVGEVEVAGPAHGPLPVGDASALEDRLDWRWVDLRRPRNRLVFEVQTTAEHAMRQWWRQHGFVEVHSPKIRGYPNQSGRELFTVQYFDRPAYLVQSPQFYKQMAMAAGFDRVFEIGPVFRANPLRTSRHDTEFTSVDVEVSWIDSHADLMDLEERWLRHVVAAVAADHGADVERHYGREVRVPDVPFPRLTMAEARAILAAHGHHGEAPEGDIDAESEKALCRHVAAETGSELVFVTDYPEAVRPFYHMRTEEGSELTRSFDLLWNGLEVTTGAQREHRYERLVAQARRNPARVEVIRTYLDFFRFGCPPHGGFGLGLTRMLMCLLGVGDVREVTYLHRGPDRLAP
ncbi:MAG TPA: aspartate--tRNA(Asn) ligase [Acidimicrobiales bacterium]|nr:aspartate--tRNA(Asn) ligase [Acidimicrobiales bacterium]